MESLKQLMGRLAWTLALLAGAHQAEAAHPYARETALSSYLRGHADLVKSAAAMVQARAAVVKAQGEANLANAKALESLQKTRSLALDNDMKAAAMFYEKRSLYESYQALQKTRERPTIEDCVRYSKMDAPERPAGSELEPQRGTIQWPPVLKHETFLEQRAQLDCLFAQRSRAEGTATTEVYGQVQTLAGQMRSDLKEMIDQMPPVEYLEAKKFIDKLAYEAQFPARPDGTAGK